MSLVGISKMLVDEFRRARHFRGHGVHSPYVYSIVRDVLMRRGVAADCDETLLATLRSVGIGERTAVELHNLFRHLKYRNYAVDPESVHGEDFVVFSRDMELNELDEILQRARDCGTTVALVQRRSVKSNELFEGIASRHHSTTVKRRQYLLVFNNHLPKQSFTL